MVAALLARQGYDVVGITLQLYDHGGSSARPGACCAGRDIHDARDVASKLGIPHYVLDYEARFRQQVITPFAEGYLRGETPIPCVACNQTVKFTDLLGTAEDLGADVLATGHYVSSRPTDGGWALHRAHDRDRDQSYFLYATTRPQLKVLRFPLGGLPKAQVRELARQFGLTAVARKADSQDICFVPSGRYSDVIERMHPGAMTGGDIVHLDGRVLGRHRGIAHYTVGQRRGLGLAENPEVGGEPLYVVKLDAARAQVLVGPREALATRAVMLRDINWIGPGSLPEAEASRLDIAVRVRSTRAPVPAILRLAGGEASVEFARDEQGVSPGQACVFYASADDDAQVLGGGIIRGCRLASAETTRGPLAAAAAA